MPHNRLPRVMKHYFPTGRRNYGRPSKRLLNTGDRNGSTSGPTPRQIYDDDDDDDNISNITQHLSETSCTSNVPRIIANTMLVTNQSLSRTCRR
jgi:hypothetical protein